jgi:hypothetical protein
MSSARIAKVRRLEKERQKANNPFPNVCFNIFSAQLKECIECKYGGRGSRM